MKTQNLKQIKKALLRLQLELFNNGQYELSDLAGEALQNLKPLVEDKWHKQLKGRKIK